MLDVFETLSQRVNIMSEITSGHFPFSTSAEQREARSVIGSKVPSRLVTMDIIVLFRVFNFLSMCEDSSLSRPSVPQQLLD